VGCGLLILIGIAYITHRMEMAKIENRRRAGLHKDRFRDISFIIDVIPGGSLQGELPSLLTSNMAMHLEKAIQLDNDSAHLKRQLQATIHLHESVVKSGELPIPVRSGGIGTELKDVQRGIKLLKEFILLQYRTGFPSKPVASVYIKSLQEINLGATIDGLLRQAVHTQGEGNKSLALRYYQLALSEITRHKSNAKFAERTRVIVDAIKELKENKRVIEGATKEINQKLVESISGKKDEDD
jgi:hypothetical protein